MPYELGKKCPECGIGQCYDGCACEWETEMQFEDLPLYKRIWFRLRDLDRSWGLFFSYYKRNRHVYAFHLGWIRLGLAWNVPEAGPYTWFVFRDKRGNWHRGNGDTCSCQPGGLPYPRHCPMD